jgi:hypothetical protein
MTRRAQIPITGSEIICGRAGKGLVWKITAGAVIIPAKNRH